MTGAVHRSTSALCLLAVLALAGCAEPRAVTTTATATIESGVAPVGERTVRVEHGDSVALIAQRYQVNSRELIEVNHLVPPYRLEPGQILRLPGTPGPSQSHASQKYKVQRGDSLGRLAQRFGVPMMTLAQTNHINPPYNVQIGQVLTIPGTSTPEATLPGSPGGVGVVAPIQTVALPPPPVPHAPEKPAVVSPGRHSTPTPAPVRPAHPTPVTPESGGSVAPAPAGAHMIWPAKGKVVSKFGTKPDGSQNDGVNISAARGAPVMAAEAGTVTYVGNELRNYGNLLLIHHKNGLTTAYAHLDHVLVQRGVVVRRGQRVGTVGATGNVTTPQLHFEVRSTGNQPVDPGEFLPPAAGGGTP